MKHARQDYDRIQDPEGKIPADEPVFLLRAQDVFAAPTIEYWARQVESYGGSPNIVKLAREQSLRMAKWPKHKIPDLPSYGGKS